MTPTEKEYNKEVLEVGGTSKCLNILQLKERKERAREEREEKEIKIVGR